MKSLIIAAAILALTACGGGEESSAAPEPQESQHRPGAGSRLPATYHYIARTTVVNLGPAARVVELKATANVQFRNIPARERIYAWINTYECSCIGDKKHYTYRHIVKAGEETSSFPLDKKVYRVIPPNSVRTFYLVYYETNFTQRATYSGVSLVATLK